MRRLTIIMFLLCTFAFLLGGNAGKQEAYAEIGQGLVELEKKVSKGL